MQPTTLDPEKGTDQTNSTDCENDYCDGPEGDRFPCFACFEPDREYDMEVTE